MARRWSGTLAEWTRRFEGWVDTPAPEALLHAAIFFDFRRVAGELELGPLEEVVARAPDRTVFLRFLARAALDFKPPQLLLLRLRGGAVDLKLHAISPVVMLARCYGLELGGTERNTVARLEAAAKAGHLPERTYAEAAEAYRWLLGLRLRLQLARIARGAPASAAVALQDLTAVERSRLKDALRAVKALQDAGTLHFRTDF
jgi:CBS domain-containing protein